MAGTTPFRIALGISLLAHSVLIVQSASLMRLPDLKKTGQSTLEVAYLKLPPKQKPPLSGRSLPAPLPDQHTALQNSPFSARAEKTVFKPRTLRESDRRVLMQKPLLGQKDVITIKKKITIPALADPPVDNPSYIRYYQLVREQIKRSAYRAYAGRERGQMALTFVLRSDGALDGIWIDEPKSSRSDYLRSIAVRSIREAAPFPRFSEELSGFSQLSFNVSITFESD